MQNAQLINQQYVMLLIENLKKIESSKQIELSYEKKLDGMNCKVCNNYSQYSISNQKDGSFICFGCRAEY